MSHRSSDTGCSSAPPSGMAVSVWRDANNTISCACSTSLTAFSPTAASAVVSCTCTSASTPSSSNTTTSTSSSGAMPGSSGDASLTQSSAATIVAKGERKKCCAVDVGAHREPCILCTGAGDAMVSEAHLCWSGSSLTQADNDSDTIIVDGAQCSGRSVRTARSGDKVQNDAAGHLALGNVGAAERTLKTNACYANLNALVQFIYGERRPLENVLQAHVSDALPQLNELLHLANEWNALAAVHYIAEALVPTVTDHNAVYWFRNSQSMLCGRLYRAAARHLLHHCARRLSLGEVLACPKNVCRSEAVNSLLELDVDELQAVLRSDDLYVEHEHDVLRVVCRWLMHKPQHLAHCSALVHCVRSGLCDSSYWRKHVTNLIGSVAGAADSHASFGGAGGRAEVVKELRLLAEPHLANRKYAQRPRSPVDVLFAVGGWSNGAPTAVVETFDRCTNTWYSLSPAVYSEPTGRAYHACALLNNVIYSVGGSDGIHYYSTTHALDLRRRQPQWVMRAPMHEARCYVAAATLNGKLYACGGYNGRRRLRTCEVYEPDTNMWIEVQPMRHERSDLGLCAVGGRLIAAGGFDGRDVLRSVELYNPDTNVWTMLAPMTNPRSGLSLTCVPHDGGRPWLSWQPLQSNNAAAAPRCEGDMLQGRAENKSGMLVLAIGGYDGQLRLSSMESLNPGHCTTDSRVPVDVWQNCPSMHDRRSNFAAAAMDGRVYVIGGYDGANTMTAVERYDTITKSWQRVGPLGSDRSALSAVAVLRCPAACRFGFQRNPTAIPVGNLLPDHSKHGDFTKAHLAQIDADVSSGDSGARVLAGGWADQRASSEHRLLKSLNSGSHIEEVAENDDYEDEYEIEGDQLFDGEV